MVSKLRLEMLGWILFIICALFYLYSGILARDLLVISGSLIFLIACFVFIYAGRVDTRDSGRASASKD